MALHERLKQAREASGLSQGQVAKKMDMHRPTISEIEAGRRKVNTSELEQFSTLYGVSATWILNGASEDNEADARIQIAAREMSKMSEQDIERLMTMLKMFRKQEKS